MHEIRSNLSGKGHFNFDMALDNFIIIKSRVQELVQNFSFGTGTGRGAGVLSRVLGRRITVLSVLYDHGSKLTTKTLHFRRLFSVMLVTCMSIRIKEKYKMAALLSEISLSSPGNVAPQAPVSVGFPRQEYWSGSSSSRSVLSDSWQLCGLQQAGFTALHHLQDLLKLLSIESVMASNHLILFSA